MASWVVPFVFWAAVYAAASVAVAAFLSRVLHRPMPMRFALFLFVTLTFVFMTQHPFPNRATLSCPVATAAPQLTPFSYWHTVERLYARGASFMGWIENKTIAETAMNFLLCGLIGFLYAFNARRFKSAVLFGASLTLAVELTQLTGIWGLYRCAYRQFSVDDLMLNALGVIAGFLVGRMVRRG